MMNMKNITTYTPKINPYADALFNIIFYRDEHGRDWYESQKLFDTESLKVCYNNKNIIVQYSHDVSMLVPDGVSVAEVADFTPEPDVDLADGTWVFDGKNIVKRTYTAQELQERVELHRQSLIDSASDTISLWQSELLLGSISDEDKANLIEWMAYIKALKAMDFSDVGGETGYDAIVWPEQPGGNNERRSL
ncbi:Caudovirales tail fibre assembly protein [Klebsiella pneumoniae]|uniref:tail fiber assembly protein n=1 Tax=Klebsiella TaxID=570 RepID=UPI000E2D5D72|nr:MULTISPECIES: tail fiber assembly protein [Klebsiella]MBK0466566.1 tail fiber assembly protein [Klebsiella aerogenes]SWY00419.1 Caudovirales tail fibre assembly protein [Klebsiella pneumoniae]